MKKLTPIQYQKLAPEIATHVLKVGDKRFFAFYKKDGYILVNQKGRKVGKKCKLGDNDWFLIMKLNKKLNRSFASGDGAK